MSISIDADACAGCGGCVAVCPGTLLQSGEQGKAFIRHPEDCWGCAACVKACPNEAVALYLSAEAGGRGSRLSARQDGVFLRWQVTHPDGTGETILVNRENANRY